jgi:endonuclease YncB( thermonuclease family)
VKTKKKKAARFLPKRGSLRSYRLVESQTIKGKKVLLVDLGFSSFIRLPRGDDGQFREGDIVVARSRFLAKKPGATQKDLYTYKGDIERVIDGDTIWVKIDLGFGVSTRQKLRLRGINAPELKTRAGKKAKRFVEEELKAVPSVIVTTTKPDKYDRYLSDIFCHGVCLNRRLLRAGLAELVRNRES